jgi:hypothetical protein
LSSIDFRQTVIARKIQKCSAKEDDFISILEKLMERLNDDLELVATIARRIWLRINSMVHGGIFLHHSNHKRKRVCGRISTSDKRLEE